MKLLRALFIFCATLFSFLNASSQINTDQVIQIGRNALYFEDYVLSIQYFNQVIAAKPYLARPYYYRAIAKFNLDDLNGAENDATNAIERNPFISEAYEIRGLIRQNLGNTALAIDDYNHALSILPENKGILFNKALALESLGEYTPAKNTYDELIQKHPSFEAAYIGRAKLFLSTSDTISAINDIDKAISINPNAINAYILRADIKLTHDNDLQSALTDLDKAIKLQPRQSGLYINRAFVRYKLDDYFGAMSDYDYALQLDPLNAPALFNRSLLRTEVRDFNNALSDLNKVIEISPNDYKAYYNRAIVNAELKNYKQAISDINRVISTFPDLAAAYFLRSDIKHRANDRTAQNDYDKSIALAKKKMALDGSLPGFQEVFGTKSVNDSLENQEAVAAKFTQLVTISNNVDYTGDLTNHGIRGRIQDHNINIEPEPLFVITYYSAPSELKPTGDYMREVDEINQMHALNYVLQITNNEATLSDATEIEKHFKNIEYYNSYLANHNPRVIDYFGRAMNQMTLHNFVEAINDFQRALNLSPDFAVAHFMSGVAKFKNVTLNPAIATNNDHQLLNISLRSAINDFENAIKHSSDMALAYYNIGVINIMMHDYNAALNAFNKAIELKPQFGEAIYNRGFVELKLGNQKDGVKDLSKAGQLGIVRAYNLLKRMS